MSIIRGVECLHCGCPALIDSMRPAAWECPMCGRGFVCVSPKRSDGLDQTWSGA